MILSEAQAETIGHHLTGGNVGEDFTVFSYVHNRSKLTMFGVDIGGNIVTTDPRAAASAQH
jgi:hypothetical protein